MLLDKGADVNARGGVFGNVLQAAVARGCTTIVELLLERGADVDARGGRSYDALQAALDQENQAIAALLLKNGAHQNLKDFESGWKSK
jgi:ankyrin repeat protein